MRGDFSAGTADYGSVMGTAVISGEGRAMVRVGVA